MVNINYDYYAFIFIGYLFGKYIEFKFIFRTTIIIFLTMIFYIINKLIVINIYLKYKLTKNMNKIFIIIFILHN
jgi:hypothetical protein